MSFEFNKQLKQGQLGEQWLLNNYERPLVRYDGYAVDFVDNLGNFIELKTEMRSVEDSPNFFIERWSNIEKEKPGGPWQSLEYCDKLVYLFLPSNTYFVFDSLPLLIANIEQRKLVIKKVFNKGYTAGGYAIKRSSLAHLYREVKVEQPNLVGVVSEEKPDV